MTVGFVVPCFNEASRWDHVYWKTLVGRAGIEWLFVNDGSTDSTERILRMHVSPEAGYLGLPHNQGKAEAVRQGLLTLADQDLEWIGFLDADAAFPAGEVLRFVDVAQDAPTHLAGIWSSRVRLRGRDIQRSPGRHYVGRVIATALGMKLKTLPYDTQSGLKIFRNTPEFLEALSRPFLTRWLFDVELFMRLENRYEARDHWLWEEPLLAWHEVAGSRITLKETLRIQRELARILLAKS